MLPLTISRRSALTALPSGLAPERIAWFAYSERMTKRAPQVRRHEACGRGVRIHVTTKHLSLERRSSEAVSRSISTRAQTSATLQRFSAVFAFRVSIRSQTLLGSPAITAPPRQIRMWNATSEPFRSIGRAAGGLNRTSGRRALGPAGRKGRLGRDGAARGPHARQPCLVRYHRQAHDRWSPR